MRELQRAPAAYLPQHVTVRHCMSLPWASLMKSCGSDILVDTVLPSCFIPRCTVDKTKKHSLTITLLWATTRTEVFQGTSHGVTRILSALSLTNQLESFYQIRCLTAWPELLITSAAEHSRKDRSDPIPRPRLDRLSVVSCLAVWLSKPRSWI